MLPIVIDEIHDIMGRIKHGERVDKGFVNGLVQQAVRDKHNFGIWVKREHAHGDDFLSVVVISSNALGERKVTGYRIEEKQPGR